MEAHARATGEVPEELERLGAGPPMGTEALWNVFLSLNNSRGSGGFGPAPISLSSIAAYSKLYSVRFTPWELDVLLELDSTVVRLISSKEKR
jgi:hypothetical protein